MAKTVVHPYLNEGIEARAYQLNALKKALGGSTLMVMPTGFGKTAVQWMMMAEYLNKGVDKILLIAPTTGLVDQQWRMAKERVKYDEHLLVKYTGETPPAKRAGIWDGAKIVFATPQVIDHDVTSERISLEEVGLLIVDEAHHAVGNHAFAKVGRHYRRQAKQPRVLAATASPGTKEEQINALRKELDLGYLDFTKKSDDLLKPYAVELDMQSHQVSMPSALKALIQPIQNLYDRHVKSLQNLGFLAPVEYVSSKHLDKAQLRASRAIQHRDVRAYDAARKIGDLRRTLMVLNLLQTQGLGPTAKFLQRAEQEKEKERKTSRFLQTKEISSLRRALDEMDEIHPKFEAVEQLVVEEIEKNPDGKIILFTEYRDTVETLYDQFLTIELTRPGQFIGQSSRGSMKGMTSKEQLKQLDAFRSGEINLLIATSVGEEGLDVPAADMVILFEPVASAIRLIQRRGRTARQRDGSVHVLVTNDTKDVYTQSASERQEQRMNAVLTKTVATKKLLDFIDSIVDYSSFQVSEDGHSATIDDFIEDERRAHATLPPAKEKQKSNTTLVEHDKAQPLPPEYLRSRQQKGLFDFDQPLPQQRDESIVDTPPTTWVHPLRATISLDGSEEELNHVGSNTQSYVDSISSLQFRDMLIYVDYRESRSTLPAFLKSLGCKVEMTYLPSGDIRLSERVLIERKTSHDLSESIKNGKLLSQCNALVVGATRPILLLEVGTGEEQRLHPNAVLGSLAYITVELGIPVVMTKNAMESAQFIAMAKKREQQMLQSLHSLVQQTKAIEIDTVSSAALAEINDITDTLPHWVDVRLNAITSILQTTLSEYFDIPEEQVRELALDNPSMNILTQVLDLDD